MAEREGRRWVLHGRVQGVFFRAFARDTARRMGVDGWVRNVPDGTVEVEASADAASLQRFKAKLEGGPPSGRVDRIEEETIEPAPAGSGFEVRV